MEALKSDRLQVNSVAVAAGSFSEPHIFAVFRLSTVRCSILRRFSNGMCQLWIQGASTFRVQRRRYCDDLQKLYYYLR